MSTATEEVRSNMRHRNFTTSVRDILSWEADGLLRIPAHQRPEIWSIRKKSEFISTLLNGLPIPSLILHEKVEDGKLVRSLEDGQQRFWSLKRFKDNLFKARTYSHEDKSYSDLSPEERASFNSYSIPVMAYENATEEERLRMFQYLQNGVPLTSGQRFNAMRSVSPLVRYATSTFMGENRRVSSIFGFGKKSLQDNKSKTQLSNAMALAGGIALGPSFMTTSYEILGPELHKPIPDKTNILENLITIYESAQEKKQWTPAELKKYQWPIGKITGYILWSLIECDDSKGDIEALKLGWITFLILLRKNINLLDVLHKKKPSSRNWTSERWKIGFYNIFIGGPTSARLNEEALVVLPDHITDSNSDTESDE
jgi:hypothetical protein